MHVVSSARNAAAERAASRLVGGQRRRDQRPTEYVTAAYLYAVLVLVRRAHVRPTINSGLLVEVPPGCRFLPASA